MRMKIYRLVLSIHLDASLQTVRKQWKISRVTCIQTVYIYIHMRGGEKGRGEKGEADVYIGAKQGRNYPRGKSARSGFKLQPGRWCLPPSNWILCFASSFHAIRAHAFRISLANWKIKDTGAYSALCRGKEDSWSIQSAGTTGRKTRMLSVVYLLGFFNPFLPTATLIALIARGM